MHITQRADGSFTARATWDFIWVGQLGLFIGYHNAATALAYALKTKVSISDVRACVAGPQAMGGVSPIRLATLEEVVACFPDTDIKRLHRPVNKGAVPTTVDFKVPGMKKPRLVHFPSMNQAAMVMGLTLSALSAIRAKAPGYRSHLRGGIHNVRFHDPGWKPAGGWNSNSAGAPPVMFELVFRSRGLVLVKPLKSSWTFTSIDNVPLEVLRLAGVLR